MRTREILKLLRDARQAATFQQASFAVNKTKNDQLIKDTQTYRDCWIVAPLDDAIAMIEASLPHDFEVVPGSYNSCGKCGLGPFHKLHTKR